MPDLRLRFDKEMLVVAPLMTRQMLDSEISNDDCLEFFNILDDELVRETHRRYRLAGAQCTGTNTLYANRFSLEKHGLEDALVDINRMGVQLAREVGYEHILATVSLSSEEILLEQVEALLAEEPDALWLVGQATDLELRAALAAIRKLTDLPLIAATTLSTEGADIEYLMGQSPQKTLESLQELNPKAATPLMVCPCLGSPEGATQQQRSAALSQRADHMADFALAARAKGAQFIGTAPGSSPVFTGAVAATLLGLDVA